jgi:hypothetical protein
MPFIDPIPDQDIRDGLNALSHLRHHPHGHPHPLSGENPDVQHVLTGLLIKRVQH